ncbi:MAG: caspase family protein [Bacteroidia bacterium]
MKGIFFFLAILFSTTLFAQTQQRKLALIIAIAEYPEETGWPSISCDKDVSLVKPVYESQGFTEMIMVKDKEATREGIRKAFNKLIGECQKGDVVLIHYSGHGQQIFDDNGDEADGLDETLVCYGAPSEYYKGYTGEKHMRDDEFGQLIDEVRMKTGKNGNVFVVVDACFSGTITRGIGKVRGGKPAIVPPGFNFSFTSEKGSGILSKEPKTRGQSVSLAPMVVFSASSFNETNSETTDDAGVGIGSLSYAMAKSLSKCGKDFTYRSLFAHVLSIMNEKVPQQTPMIEGDEDYALFGGSYVRQQPYFTIKEINEGKIILNAGELMGVFEQTKVALYPAGTINTENAAPLAKGEIIRSGPYSSSVKLDKEIASIVAANYWVFITEPALKNIALKYRFEKISDQNAMQKIQTELSKSGIVKRNEKNPDILIDHRGNFYRIVRSSDGFIIDSVKDNDASFAGAISASLKLFAENKYLREMKTGFSNQVFLQLIPCDENGKVMNPEIRNGIISIRAGGHTRVKIKNTSSARLYFNIIDIQPDEKINPVFPKAQELTLKHAEQYVMEPNSEKELPDIMDISPPFGNEVFKVFACSEPFNLTPAIVNRGIQTRGIGTSLMDTFKHSEIQTRGVNSKKNAVQELYTSELVFKIVP